MRILLVVFVCAFASVAQARTVVASVEPLAMLARQVLGERAEVVTLLRPDQTPHFASFTPSQARNVRDADLILWLGEEAEPHLAGLLARSDAGNLALLSLPGVRRLEGGREHDHDPGHDEADHGAASLDPHLWLSPDNALLLARALAREFAMDDGALARFEQTLAQSVEQVRGELAPYQGRGWLSYHDPWHYFREAVGLSAPLVISEGLQSDTSSRHFAELAQAVGDKQVRCAIAEPEARISLMQRLCSGDCRIQPLDPLGRDAGTRTYTGFLRHLGDSFHQCLAD